MAIDAVVFDIGNVLIEWVPERFFDRLIGPERRRALFAEVDLHALNDDLDRGAALMPRLREAAREYPQWAREIMIWGERWLELAGPVIAPSVALMAALKARGVPVIALSNFGRETFAMAEARWPFLRDFDARFISGHLGMIKPEPGIYAAVERATGLTPERLLFTDDRADNIAAAAARGWQVHHFSGAEGLRRRLVAEGLLAAEGRGEAGSGAPGAQRAGQTPAGHGQAAHGQAGEGRAREARPGGGAAAGKAGP